MPTDKTNTVEYKSKKKNLLPTDVSSLKSPGFCCLNGLVSRSFGSISLLKSLGSGLKLGFQRSHAHKGIGQRNYRYGDNIKTRVVSSNTKEQWKNHGNKDMYTWIHQQSFESRDIPRQEIEISASKAAEQKCISKDMTS
jgi:hypothetical protein